MSTIPKALDIPFEIASKIFYLCIPVDKRSRPSLDQAPISISQVCQLWRSISLANPGLWSSIAVETRCDDDYELAGKSVVEEPSSKLLKLWFTRAGNHSLSLNANCKGNGVPPWFLDTLLAYAPHCCYIEIEMHRRPCNRFLHTQGPGPFPFLQFRTIKLPVPHRLAHNSTLLFQPAPELKMLRLIGNLIPKSYNDIGPGGLTDLEIGGWLSFPECTPIFTDFPHLRRLSLSNINVLTLPSSLPPLKELECLSLASSVELLHLLAVPKLRSLTIGIGYESKAELLLAFLSTLRGQLTELVLNIWISVSNVGLYACLDAVPQLVTLKLRFHDPTRLFYDLPPLLYLRTFIVSNIDGPSDFYQSILAMLSSINLSRLEFYLYKDDDEDASPAEGLDVATFAAFNEYAQQGCIVWVTTPTLTWPEDRDDTDSGGCSTAFRRINILTSRFADDCAEYKAVCMDECNLGDF
jgi:hypothetical protein